MWHGPGQTPMWVQQLMCERPLDTQTASNQATKNIVENTDFATKATVTLQPTDSKHCYSMRLKLTVYIQPKRGVELSCRGDGAVRK